MFDSEAALISIPDLDEDEPLAPSLFTTRPVVRGKFLYVDNQKFWIKGVTYGTFRPDEEGNQYGGRQRVEDDFHSMVENGINCVRTYTVPPAWLLDMAQKAGLRIMVGLPWEQHITFLDDKERAGSIERRIRDYVRECGGHPSVLCYAVGNEIPASIVRWYGRKKIERFIHRLYSAVKEEDQDSLVTYVNFPPTEYLRLPFLDIVSFNVYLETSGALKKYLARLNNLAEDRPLLMAEIGLDSHRNGVLHQASALEWQVRSTFEAGCCGAFVFAWTDEWHRGGDEIEDWQFGLTTRNRLPKPALKAVRSAFNDVMVSPRRDWPMISVVVCTFNGEATIRETLQGLGELDYPNYEVIVVNDGSTDRTPEIVSEYGVKMISTTNRGLSSARNTGLQAASGSIIAYIDDDAYPDPHWLRYLAIAFLESDYAGVGGPNLVPQEDSLISHCVANAPGGPNHVLLTDTVAEHIPGCNMAFRKQVLESIGGFDQRFRVAGDDVDVCWRVQENGGIIGFSPAAMVWHHRRKSIKAFWRQQKGYGRAEALLEAKWPEKYNSWGHVAWNGRIYGNGTTLYLGALRNRIYHGVWGSALFQSLYQKPIGGLSSLPLMPEWFLVIAALTVLAAAGFFWTPLLVPTVPLLVLSIAIPMIQALMSASGAKFPNKTLSRWQRVKLVSLIAILHLQQPLARLWGRLNYGLTPWRKRINGTRPARIAPVLSMWREQWMDPNEMLGSLLFFLRKSGAFVLTGGEFDSWDLEIRGGLLGRSRLRMAVEEHGRGKQMIRFGLREACTTLGITLILLPAFLSILAALDGVWVISGLFFLLTAVLFIRAMLESMQSRHLLYQAIKEIGEVTNSK